MMTRTTNKPLPVRSTPKSMNARDTDLFPRLTKTWRAHGYPTYFYVRIGPRLTTVTVDYFFVPHEIRRNLQRLYRQYLDWRIHQPGKKEKTYHLPSFQDYTSLEVLTEHALWWIELFESAASVLVEPYHLTEADRQEDYREVLAQQKAREDEKRRVADMKPIARALNRVAGPMKNEERQEAQRLLAEFAHAHPGLWDAMSFTEKIGKGISLRKQVAAVQSAQTFLATADAWSDKRPAPPTYAILDPPPSKDLTSTAPAFFHREPLPKDLKVRDTFSPTPPMPPQKKGAHAVVKLFQDKDTFAVQTNADNEPDFISEFGVTLAQFIVKSSHEEEDLIFAIVRLLPPFVEICCKLRGYKSASHEERLITAGYIAPQAASVVGSMDDHKRVLVAQVPKPENGDEA